MSTSVDLGVFFGGSSMSISYFREDKVTVVVNEAGDRTTPALLAIEESAISVGLPAKQNLIRNSKNTIGFTKNFIGYTDLESINKDLIQKLGCEVIIGEDKQIRFCVEKDDKPYEMSLAEAMEHQFDYLIDLAKTSLGAKECDICLNYPNNFTAEQCTFLKDCAEKAGFNVLRMVKNPIAACLAYNLEEDQTKDSTILVFHMGDHTLELSLVRICNGLYRRLDTINLDSIAGFRFTDAIVDILVDEFQRKNRNQDPRTNKRSMHKVKASAKELKHILATMERAHSTIDALYDGIDFDYYLTRQRMDGACNKLYQQALEPIDQLLSKNGLTHSQIDYVVLSGGSTKLVKLQAMIRAKFPESKVLSHISPDEVIADGCAKQCTLIKSSKMQSINVGDETFKTVSKPIYLQTGKSEELQLVCEAQTPLPFKRTIELKTDLDNPSIGIFENKKDQLAKVNLSDFKTTDVSFQVNIKLDESVEITVTETSTKEHITFFLNDSEQ